MLLSTIIREMAIECSISQKVAIKVRSYASLRFVFGLGLACYRGPFALVIRHVNQIITK